MPTEEADVLSKLLAEVAGASVTNVLHGPAVKVRCVHTCGPVVCNPEMRQIFTLFDPFHRTQVLDWPIFPSTPPLTS